MMKNPEKISTYEVVCEERLQGDWQLSTTVYNLFDKDHSDPSSGGLDAVEQDGRTLRLKAVFRFCRS
jgi:outer membrane receptor protein involved in Fe transport